MWFIGVEVEQETSASPPKKNPGSAPEISDPEIATNWPYSLSCPKPLFKARLSAKKFDLKLIFYSHAKKTPGGQGCFQKNWVGVCARFLKPLPYFRPKSVFISALFQT